MLQEIQDIIKKNLPAEIGNNLQKVLADGEAAKREVDRLNSYVKDYTAQIKALKATIETLEAKLKVAGNLDEREKLVTNREIKMEVHDANMMKAATDQSLAQLYRLTEIAFRNPKIIRTYEDYEDVPIKGQYGIERHSKTTKHIETEETNPPHAS